MSPRIVLKYPEYYGCIGMYYRNAGLPVFLPVIRLYIERYDSICAIVE